MSTVGQKSHGNREVEYAQTISYVQHMYDTRHQIFQFAVALNTGLLAVVFQFLTTTGSRLALSMLGGFVTLAITLMARRSWRYLSVLEQYAAELESKLGFGLVRETSSRMPKGADSTVYLFLIYWAFVLCGLERCIRRFAPRRRLDEFALCRARARYRFDRALLFARRAGLFSNCCLPHARLTLNLGLRSPLRRRLLR